MGDLPVEEEVIIPPQSVIPSHEEPLPGQYHSQEIESLPMQCQDERHTVSADNSESDRDDLLQVSLSILHTISENPDRDRNAIRKASSLFLSTSSSSIEQSREDIIHYIKTNKIGYLSFLHKTVVHYTLCNYF